MKEACIELMRPFASLSSLVVCLITSRIVLDAEPPDPGGGFGTKDTEERFGDTEHFG